MFISLGWYRLLPKHLLWLCLCLGYWGWSPTGLVALAGPDSNATTYTAQAAQLDLLLKQWQKNPKQFKHFRRVTEHLLLLGLWMKDNFELADAPILKTSVMRILPLLAQTKLTEQPDLKAVKAAYYWLNGNRKFALAIVDSTPQAQRHVDLQLIKALVGKPANQGAGVWRMDVSATQQLAHAFPQHAMAQALVAEAVLEMVVQPEPRHPLLLVAQKSLQTAIKLAPANLFYRYQQAQVLFLQGQPQPAWQAFGAVIRDSHQNPIILEAVGNFYLWMNDKGHAITLYQQVLAAEPGHLRLYKKLEVAFLQSPRSLEQAIAMYLEAIEKYPEQAALAQQLIRLQAESDYQLELLQVRLQQSLSKWPQHYRLHYLQGYWHGLAGQNEAAEQAYLKAIQYHGKFKEAYQQLFGLYWEQQAFDQLKTLLKQAQALLPKYAEAYYWQGLLAIEEDQASTAIAALQTALQWRPNWDAAYQALAVAFRMNKEFEKSHRIFAQMLQKSPENPEIIMSIGDTYLQEKKYAQAERHYLWVSHLEPYQVGAYFSLGNLYSEMEVYDKAIQAFERAILIAPWNPDNRNNLGNVYLRDRQTGLARDMFQRILRFAPDYATAYYNLACAYALEDKRGIAIRYLQHAFKLDQSLKKTAADDADLNNLHPEPGYRDLFR